MSLYVRLYCSFFSHRKTRRLRAKIGNDAFWVPPRLWAYAATNQPDGDFHSYSAEDIADGIGYTSDAQALLQALLEAQFLDPDLKLHDWAIHSGFHDLYAQRARKAASVRWEKERSKEREDEERAELNRAELSKHCSEQSSSTATSNASSIRTVGNVGVSVSMRRPRNVEEVIAKGQFIGLGEPECRQWFIDCEACNWVRGDGSPFDNWPRQLCIHRDKLRSLPHQPNGKPTSGADIRMVIQMKEERAREIKERWSTDGPVSTDWNNEEKKQEFFSLKKEIKQLKAKAERLVS